MTIADAPHGRSRYTRGCRCGTCKQANREYQRRHRSKHLQPVPPRDPQPAEFIDGPVTEAVRAQLAEAIIAGERPGLIAIALVLAADLDNPHAVPQRAALAHRLTEILAALSKSATRGGRLRVVRGMTDKT